MSLPPDETLRAFDDLIHAGKVLYIGCSNHPAWRVMESLAISEQYHLARYISEQPPYNLLDRRVENELIPLCQKYGLAVIPWSPLAGGILAGRYPPGAIFQDDSRAVRLGDWFKQRISQRGREVASKVGDMAQERGMTPAQLALLWLKDQPGVTAPIIGPRTMEHLESFIPLMDRKLDDRDRPLFDALVHPGNAVADFRNTSGWTKEQIGY
jgi:aryl-alcohol dehydrogenase-like predicted oxidoreductase